MATRIEVQGLRTLRTDLRRIDRQLPAQLNRKLKTVAEPIRAAAAREAPRSRINRPGYLHTADSLKVSAAGSRVAIVSRKPGIKTIYYGGRHPLFGDRDHWYQQKPNRFIDRAAVRFAVKIERDVAATVERTMHSAGFK